MSELKQIKKVKNATLFEDSKGKKFILLQNVRCSYPNLHKPYGDGEKYSVVALLPKETHVAAKEMCLQVLNDLMKENKCAKLAAERKFIKNGDDSGKDENEGCWTVGAADARKPSIRDRSAKLIESDKQIQEMIYGGCWVNILIRPWFQNNKDYGKRVNASLQGVQFVEDGEAFGEGRIDDTDAWEVLEEDSDWDDNDDDGL